MAQDTLGTRGAPLRMLIGWVVYLNATTHSLGVLGIGMRRSYVRRRLSGQTDVDAVNLRRSCSAKSATR